MLAPSAQRVAAAQALSDRLPRIHAHAVEHACHSLAASQGVNYKRLVFRSLDLLERGCVDAGTVERLGPRAVAGAPLELLVSRIPARKDIVVQEELRRRSAALLQHLTADESMDIPDAGLRCKKCGCTDIRYDFLQTRSADEPMSCFCTCEQCGKRWRM